MRGTYWSGSLWRYSALLAVVALYLSSVTACMAQTVHPAPQATAPLNLPARQELPASVTHSAVKTATLKIASAVVSVALFYGGTGSVADAGMLSAISAVGSSALFGINDYLWDYFSPNTNIRANDKAFDVAASAWRNTLKYATVKPLLIAFGYGAVYWYTGSWSSAVTLGTASIFAFPAAFYANNMGWDWYDWYSASGDTSPVPADPAFRNGGS